MRDISLVNTLYKIPIPVLPHDVIKCPFCMFGTLQDGSMQIKDNCLEITPSTKCPTCNGSSYVRAKYTPYKIGDA